MQIIFLRILGQNHYFIMGVFLHFISLLKYVLRDSELVGLDLCTSR